MGNNNEADNIESSSEPLSRVVVGGFQLAEKYAHLAGAPMGEFETCETESFGIVDLRAPGLATDGTPPPASASVKKSD